MTAAVSEPNPAPGRAYAVERLTLGDFRSYGDARIETDGAPCVLTGANGAGKTNVLEALSFLAPGRGLRRARAAEIGRRDVDAEPAAPGRPWAVAARLTGPGGRVDVGTGTLAAQTVTDGSERRRVRVDGADGASQAALAEHLAITWLTPQMDGLFTDSPTARRRFLDRLVYGFDAAHAGRVAAYEHGLRERMRVLQSGRAEPGWLDALEATIAEKGVAVAAARLGLVHHLDAVCAAETQGPFPAARVHLEGEVETWLAAGPALAAEDACRDRLARNRARDAEAGRAGFAPHRADLSVVYAAKNEPAHLCSTGEQKALLIGLVLAHADLIARTQGAAPVLLLDEVAAHLDEHRRRALFGRLAALGCQFWITGTEAHAFADLSGRAAFFTVSDGTIRAAIDRA